MVKGLENLFPLTTPYHESWSPKVDTRFITSPERLLLFVCAFQVAEAIWKLAMSISKFDTCPLRSTVTFSKAQCKEHIDEQRCAQTTTSMKQMLSGWDKIYDTLINFTQVLFIFKEEFSLFLCSAWRSLVAGRGTNVDTTIPSWAGPLFVEFAWQHISLNSI